VNKEANKTFEDHRIPIITAARSASTSTFAIAPDVPIVTVMLGTIPYVLCMMLAIVILCFFPEIATWLQDHLMDRGG